MEHYNFQHTAVLTNDGHQGVEVADVEALSGNVNEELNDSGSLLLLYWLDRGSITKHVRFNKGR